MANHADNLRVRELIDFGRVGIEVQILADGILPRKILFRQAFIDHDDRSSMLIVSGGEKASTLYRNLHYLQIVRLHVILNGHGVIARICRLWPPNKPEVIFVVAAHGMCAPTERSSLNSGR